MLNFVENEKRFGALEVGATFIYLEAVYMRINKEGDTDYAVNLETGTIRQFDKEAFVIPRDYEVHELTSANKQEDFI